MADKEEEEKSDSDAVSPEPPVIAGCPTEDIMVTSDEEDDDDDDDVLLSSSTSVEIETPTPDPAPDRNRTRKAVKSMVMTGDDDNAGAPDSPLPPGIPSIGTDEIPAPMDENVENKNIDDDDDDTKATKDGDKRRSAGDHSKRSPSDCSACSRTLRRKSFSSESSRRSRARTGTGSSIEIRRRNRARTRASTFRRRMTIAEKKRFEASGMREHLHVQFSTFLVLRLKAWAQRARRTVSKKHSANAALAATSAKRTPRLADFFAVCGVDLSKSTGTLLPTVLQQYPPNSSDKHGPQIPPLFESWALPSALHVIANVESAEALAPRFHHAPLTKEDGSRNFIASLRFYLTFDCTDALHGVICAFQEACTYCNVGHVMLSDVKKEVRSAIGKFRAYVQERPATATSVWGKELDRKDTLALCDRIESQIDAMDTKAKVYNLLCEADTTVLKLAFAEIHCVEIMSKQHSEFHVPIAIALMSKYPFFDAFESMLRQIGDMVVGNVKIAKNAKDFFGPLELAIVRVIDEIPAPVRGQGCIEFRLHPELDPIECHQAPLNTLPLCEAKMAPLFKVLNPDALCTLWWALLQEEKVVVLCEDHSVLGNMCEAMMALIYPLKWCFPRLDIVPAYPKTMANVIFSPTPAIFGMCESQLPNGFRINNPDNDGPIILDVDQRRLRTNKYLDDAPMPSWLRHRIVQGLHHVNVSDVASNLAATERVNRDVRRIFFEALAVILKASTDFISPSWNGRGEWTECPDLEKYRAYLEDTLDFHSESAQNFCSTQMLRQYFELIIRSPLSEPIWDVLFVVSKTQHRMPPFDCAHGRFFEDSTLESATDVKYRIKDAPTPDKRKRRSRHASKSEKTQSLLHVVRLERMPVPCPSVVPWDTINKDSIAIARRRRAKRSDSVQARQRSYLMREEKFMRLLGRVQPWMYTSGDTIDKRCRYAEAVNEQGIVGCSVLHDDILSMTSAAMQKLSKSLDAVRLTEYPYKSIGTDGDASPLLQEYVWGPIDLYVNAWAESFRSTATQLKRYQVKILDLQRRLRNHNSLLEHFEQRTRVRLFKLKGSAEEATREYRSLVERRDRAKASLAASDDTAVSPEALLKISEIENQLFAAALRRNRCCAALFFELPRSPEAMEYILMRLKVLEQERCQITANNLRWVGKCLSSMLSSIELRLSQTIGLSTTYDIEAKGMRQHVNVPENIVGGMDVEVTIDWPSSKSTKKVFTLTAPKGLTVKDRSFEAIFPHPLFLAVDEANDGNLDKMWKQLFDQTRRFQLISGRIGKWSRALDEEVKDGFNALKLVLTTVHDQLSKSVFGKGDKLIEQIKRVTNQCIKTLATMTRDIATHFKECIFNHFEDSIQALVTKQKKLSLRVSGNRAKYERTKSSLSRLSSLLSSKKRNHSSKVDAKAAADRAVAEDTRYPSVMLSLNSEQWSGLKTKKGSSTFSFESNNLVVSGFHNGTHRHYFESRGLRTKHMLLALDHVPVIGHKYSDICDLVKQTFDKNRGSSAQFTFGSKKCGPQYAADIAELRAKKEENEYSEQVKRASSECTAAKKELDSCMRQVVSDLVVAMKTHVRSMHACCKAYAKKQIEMIRQLSKTPRNRIHSIAKELQSIDTDTLYEDYIRTNEEIKTNGEAHMKTHAPFLARRHLPFAKADALWEAPEIESSSATHRTMAEHFDRSHFARTTIIDVFEKSAIVVKSLLAGSQALCRAETTYATELNVLARSISMPKHSPRNHHAKWLKTVEDNIRKTAKETAKPISSVSVPSMRRACVDLECRLASETSADESGTVGIVRREFRIIGESFGTQQQKSDASLAKMQKALNHAIELESEFSEQGVVSSHLARVNDSSSQYTWYGAKKVPSIPDVLAQAKSIKDESEVQFQLESDMLLTATAIRELSEDLLYSRIESELKRWLDSLVLPLTCIRKTIQSCVFDVTRITKISKVIAMGMMQTKKLCATMKARVENSVENGESFFVEDDDWGFDTLEDFIFVWEYMILEFIKLFSGMDGLMETRHEAWPSAAGSVPKLWMEQTKLRDALVLINEIVGSTKECIERDHKFIGIVLKNLQKLLIEVRWTKHALIEIKERVVMLDGHSSARETRFEALKCLEIVFTWCEKVDQLFAKPVDDLISQRKTRLNVFVSSASEKMLRAEKEISTEGAIQEFIHQHSKNSL